mmetsp:Transcript_19610/g.42868  ORF Transcript_19610/g.42868 Transcript_19610/m.42868 type:complete len:320 (+) Transcript_19610:73-1032(+)
MFAAQPRSQMPKGEASARHATWRRVRRVGLRRCTAMTAAALSLQWLAGRRFDPMSFATAARGLSCQVSRLGCRAEKTPGETRGASQVAPVVDDSDFDLGGSATASNNAPAKKSKAASFDSLLEAADNFATKKDRKKRRGIVRSETSAEKAEDGLSLMDDIRGLSLEDDVDLDISMSSSARRQPKTEQSMEGRLGAWLSETWQLITNPTAIQINYVVIFASSVGFLLLLVLLTFSLGAVRLKGEIDYDAQKLQQSQSGFALRQQIMRATRDAYMKYDGDVRDMKGLGGNSGVSDAQYKFTPDAVREAAKARALEESAGSQ